MDTATIQVVTPDASTVAVMPRTANLHTVVRLLDSDDERPWWDYVLTHPAGTVFHDPAWSWAVEHSYAHRPYHLGAFAAGRMVGVLPMFLVRSKVVGRVLVSVPYATYGGILAETLGIARTLMDQARRLCEELGCRYVELRHREPSGLELPEIDRCRTFRTPLPDHLEDLWALWPREVTADAASRLGDDTVISLEHLDTVYRLYAATQRRRGRLNCRRSFFHRLAEAYGQELVCLVVREGGTAVAGVVALVFRDEILPYFAGNLPSAEARRAEHVMVLRLVEHAVERGLRWCDFAHTTLGEFLRDGGFQPTPLHYQLCAVNGHDVENPRFGGDALAPVGWLWRHLPVGLTRPLGERMSQWIP